MYLHYKIKINYTIDYAYSAIHSFIANFINLLKSLSTYRA